MNASKLLEQAYKDSQEYLEELKDQLNRAKSVVDDEQLHGYNSRNSMRHRSVLVQIANLEYEIDEIKKELERLEEKIWSD